MVVSESSKRIDFAKAEMTWTMVFVSHLDKLWSWYKIVEDRWRFYWFSCCAQSLVVKQSEVTTSKQIADTWSPLTFVCENNEWNRLCCKIPMIVESMDTKWLLKAWVSLIHVLCLWGIEVWKRLRWIEEIVFFRKIHGEGSLKMTSSPYSWKDRYSNTF